MSLCGNDTRSRHVTRERSARTPAHTKGEGEARAPTAAAALAISHARVGPPTSFSTGPRKDPGKPPDPLGPPRGLRPRRGVFPPPDLRGGVAPPALLPPRQASGRLEPLVGGRCCGAARAGGGGTRRSPRGPLSQLPHRRGEAGQSDAEDAAAAGSWVPPRGEGRSSSVRRPFLPPAPLLASSSLQALVA